jgi:hypothetical protein
MRGRRPGFSLICLALPSSRFCDGDQHTPAPAVDQPERIRIHFLLGWFSSVALEVIASKERKSKMNVNSLQRNNGQT